MSPLGVRSKPQYSFQQSLDQGAGVHDSGGVSTRCMHVLTTAHGVCKECKLSVLGLQGVYGVRVSII